jgi:hypothetical protein
VDSLTGEYDMSAIVALAGAVSPTDDAFSKNFDVLDQCNGQTTGRKTQSEAQFEIG